MAENSNIEWTHHTFNPWIGCTKVAAGCANCYAEALMDNRYGKVQWGAGGTRVKTAPTTWKAPLKWNRWARDGVCWRCGGTGRERTKGRRGGAHEKPCAACAATGNIGPYRARVFCASLADVFEEWDGPMINGRGQRLAAGARGSTMDDLRRDLFALIDQTPWLDWLLVTKRPENIRPMWPAIVVNSQQQADDRNERGELYRSNCWLLTSVSDQPTAERNWQRLEQCADLAPVLGFSAEPLLEPIDFPSIWRNGRLPDWIIVGGESGRGARPFTLGWGKDIVRQGQAAGVPVFVKQVGANAVNREAQRCPHIKHPKGGDPAEWPEALRVRQFPNKADG